MTPILGIIASSRPPIAAGDYESIATVTVGSGGAANVEFTSIGTDWTHLQIRTLFRGTAAANYLTTVIRFNDDSATNYAGHELFGDGSGAFAAAESNANAINYGPFGPAANVSSNIFGTGIIDILDYANTNKNKTIRNLNGFDNNSSTSPIGHILFRSGLWRSTSAITKITLTPSSGNWAQYSHFALYGIKSA